MAAVIERGSDLPEESDEKLGSSLYPSKKTPSRRMLNSKPLGNSGDFDKLFSRVHREILKVHQVTKETNVATSHVEEGKAKV